MKKNDAVNNRKNNLKYLLICIGAGAISGAVNGIFGGGGGMIIVPMLSKLLKYKEKEAHATAILIILPLSIVSGILYFVFGNFDFLSGLPVVIGVLIGGIIGAIMLSKLSSKWIMLIFSIIMAIAGVKMLFF